MCVSLAASTVRRPNTGGRKAQPRRALWIVTVLLSVLLKELMAGPKLEPTPRCCYKKGTFDTSRAGPNLQAETEQFVLPGTVPMQKAGCPALFNWSGSVRPWLYLAHWP